MKSFFSSAIEQRSLPTAATHNFYLYGEVSSDINEYVDMIATLDYAQENDTINIYINTPGGSLNTSISIIHAILRSKAQIITHADGEVASAGTLIFFAGQIYIVYPYSHFMFHDASEGSMGKINENIKRVHATANLIDKIIYDLYTPVFTEDEVDAILEGRDYYCDAEEMYDRIKAVNDAEQNDKPDEDIENTELLVEAFIPEEIGDSELPNEDFVDSEPSSEYKEVQDSYPGASRYMIQKPSHYLDGCECIIDLGYDYPYLTNRCILKDGTVVYLDDDYLVEL